MKKLLLTLSILIFSSLLLAGCGRKDKDDNLLINGDRAVWDQADVWLTVEAAGEWIVGLEVTDGEAGEAWVTVTDDQAGEAWVTVTDGQAGEAGVDVQAGAATPGVFVVYNADVVKNAQADGKTVVLDFSAAWDPISVAFEEDVKANVAWLPANVVLVQVDYDANEGLRKQYNVTSQNTFLHVDASNNEVKRMVWGVSTVVDFSQWVGL